MSATKLTKFVDIQSSGVGICKRHVEVELLDTFLMGRELYRVVHAEDGSISGCGCGAIGSTFITFLVKKDYDGLYHYCCTSCMPYHGTPRGMDQ